MQPRKSQDGKFLARKFCVAETSLDYPHLYQLSIARFDTKGLDPCTQ